MNDREIAATFRLAESLEQIKISLEDSSNPVDCENIPCEECILRGICSSLASNESYNAYLSNFNTRIAPILKHYSKEDAVNEFPEIFV